MDIIDEIPHVLLYWGLDIESQWSLRCLQGNTYEIYSY